MLGLFRTLSLRQIVRHRARAGLIVASIALGVAAWTTTTTLDQAMGAALRASGTPMAGTADLYVSNGEAGFPRAVQARLAGVEGVVSVSPVVIERVLLPKQGGQMAVLLGVDLTTAEADSKALGLHSSIGAKAGFLKAKLFRQWPALVSETLRREMPNDGNRLEVIANGSPRTITVVGTFGSEGAGAALGSLVLITDDRTAAELAGKPDRISRFDVTLKTGIDRKSARRRLIDVLGRTGEVLTPESQAGRAGESLEALRVGFALCGAAALGLGLFLVANVMAVGVTERRREIGTLRSFGATKRQILGLFLSEAAGLGVVGGVVGVPLGWAIARFTLGSMLRVVGDVFVPVESLGTTFDSRTALTGVLAALATTLLAALGPAAKAAAEPPIETLSIGPTNRHGLSRWRKIAPFALAAVGTGCYVLGDFLPNPLQLYAPLVLGLLAALLLVPLVAEAVAYLLRPIAEGLLGLPGRLAAESLIRVPARGGAAIAAVAAGVALMIQTGGVIQGNADAVREWVDRSVSGDLFVTSGGPLSASGRTLPMLDDIGTRIEETIPGIRLVPMRFRHLPWRHNGAESSIRLFAMDARRYVLANADRSPPLADIDLYRKLAEPGTVLISENFAGLYGVKIGDFIDLPGASGTIRLKVVGKVLDFSNSRGTVIVDRARYQAAFAAEGVDVFALTLPSDSSDLEAARRRILSAPWAAENAIDVMTRSALRGHILGMVARLYRLAYLQEILVAIVASLGVATAMLVSVLQRGRELKLLRAAGATRLQVFITVIAEAVMIDVIGVVFGVLIGVPLGWYVLRVVLLHETGFSFPVRFPASDGALIAILVVVSGLPAGFLPALRAARSGLTEGQTRL